MKFSGAVGCILGRSNSISGPIATIIARKANNIKKWGLGGGLYCLNACNVLPLAALFQWKWSK